MCAGVQTYQSENGYHGKNLKNWLSLVMLLSISISIIFQVINIRIINRQILYSLRVWLILDKFILKCFILCFLLETQHFIYLKINDRRGFIVIVVLKVTHEVWYKKELFKYECILFCNIKEVFIMKWRCNYWIYEIKAK